MAPQGPQLRGTCPLELSSLELYAVDADQRTLSMTMDSGAAETVTHKNEAVDEVLTPANSERDMSYSLPDGKIHNEGEKHVRVRTKEGSKCVIKMQVTDVRKSLMSVSRVCDEGHRVVFEAAGGYIEHSVTGESTCFEREGGVYILDVEIVPAAVFSGQGK